MLLETVFVLELAQSFLTGLRTGKFIVDVAGFSHKKELELAADFLSDAMESKDVAMCKEAIGFFKKISLDDVAYYQVLSFFGQAVCNAIIGNYHVAKKYCQLAERKDITMFKDSASVVKAQAKSLRNNIETNGLLTYQPKEEEVKLIPELIQEGGKIRPNSQSDPKEGELFFNWE